MGFTAPRDTPRRRTFREELNLWTAWRDSQPVYQSRAGLDHNRPLFGIITFAYQQGWIPKSLLLVQLVFMIELLSLIPISAFSPGVNVLMLDFSAMVITIGYLCLRLWFCSKLVFATFVPLLVAMLAFTAILGQAGSA